MTKKAINLSIIVCFIFTSFAPMPMAHADSLNLPAVGQMVNLSPRFDTALIKGLTVHKDNPFLFDFIIDPGQDKASEQAFKEDANRMIKYFFASLTVPDKDIWVNLSPYEKDRIVPASLGQTDMGRELLAQDYLLKQLTASLIYPQDSLGKTFWQKVYSQAKAKYGTSNIAVNTFNKVWILPQRADIYERGQTAYIVHGHLKVMLEQDYVAMQHNRSGELVEPEDFAALSHQRDRAESRATARDLAMQKASKSILRSQTRKQFDEEGLPQIVREIILPEIEKEVNEGKNFAQLRKIFYAQVMAVWFKRNVKQALLNQVYADKSIVKGIDQNDPKTNEMIFQQYLKAYKKGVFNFIKEDQDPITQQEMPRKYFSGGYAGNAAALAINKTSTPPTGTDNTMTVSVLAGKPGKGPAISGDNSMVSTAVPTPDDMKNVLGDLIEGDVNVIPMDSGSNIYTVSLRVANALRDLNRRKNQAMSRSEIVDKLFGKRFKTAYPRFGMDLDVSTVGKDITYNSRTKDQLETFSFIGYELPLTIDEVLGALSELLSTKNTDVVAMYVRDRQVAYQLVLKPSKLFSNPAYIRNAVIQRLSSTFKTVETEILSQDFIRNIQGEWYITFTAKKASSYKRISAVRNGSRPGGPQRKKNPPAVPNRKAKNPPPAAPNRRAKNPPPVNHATPNAPDKAPSDGDYGLVSLQSIASALRPFVDDVEKVKVIERQSVEEKVVTKIKVELNKKKIEEYFGRSILNIQNSAIQQAIAHLLDGILQFYPLDQVSNDYRIIIRTSSEVAEATIPLAQNANIGNKAVGETSAIDPKSIYKIIKGVRLYQINDINNTREKGLLKKFIQNELPKVEIEDVSSAPLTLDDNISILKIDPNKKRTFQFIRNKTEAVNVLNKEKRYSIKIKINGVVIVLVFTAEYNPHMFFPSSKVIDGKITDYLKANHISEDTSMTASLDEEPITVPTTAQTNMPMASKLMPLVGQTVRRLFENISDVPKLRDLDYLVQDPGFNNLIQGHFTVFISGEIFEEYKKIKPNDENIGTGVKDRINKHFPGSTVQIIKVSKPKLSQVYEVEFKVSLSNSSKAAVIRTVSNILAASFDELFNNASKTNLIPQSDREPSFKLELSYQNILNYFKASDIDQISDELIMQFLNSMVYTSFPGFKANNITIIRNEARQFVDISFGTVQGDAPFISANRVISSAIWLNEFNHKFFTHYNLDPEGKSLGAPFQFRALFHSADLEQVMGDINEINIQAMLDLITHDINPSYAVQIDRITTVPEGGEILISFTVKDNVLSATTSFPSNTRRHTPEMITPGGIDLSQQDDAIKVSKDANGGVSVFVDPKLIERIRRQGLLEINPVIINIQQTNSSLLFG